MSRQVNHILFPCITISSIVPQVILALLYTFISPFVIVPFHKMAVKIRISSDAIKAFFGKGDVVAWFCKINVGVRLQCINDIVSLMALFMEGSMLALYLEMDKTK